MKLRNADFAGSWYPGGKSDCRRTIEDYVKACLPCPGGIKELVAGIVPHAGWYYSGLIACNVIKCLDRVDKPDTCIIFGRHLHPGGNNYIMKEGGWDTPLGELKIDADLAKRLAGEFPFKAETADRYEHDNTIELQLPFIKYFFPETRIVPVGLPPKAETLSIAAGCARIARELGRSVIVLGSTDLTHYGHNYGFTPKGTGNDALDWVKNVNDRRVVDLMVKMDEKGVIAEALRNYNACCSGAAGAAIAAAKELGAVKGAKITYSTSHDIRPDSSFVGYVGVVFGK